VKIFQSNLNAIEGISNHAVLKATVFNVSFKIVPIHREMTFPLSNVGNFSRKRLKAYIKKFAV